jgi:hypothetical protein
MDTTPFTIRFLYQGGWLEAEIKPCCKDDSVVDYAVWMKNKLEFTITRDRAGNAEHWVVALQNADDIIDPIMVDTIGRQISLKMDAGQPTTS